MNTSHKNILGNEERDVSDQNQHGTASTVMMAVMTILTKLWLSILTTPSAGVFELLFRRRPIQAIPNVQNPVSRSERVADLKLTFATTQRSL